MKRGSLALLLALLLRIGCEGAHAMTVEAVCFDVPGPSAGTDWNSGCTDRVQYWPTLKGLSGMTSVAVCSVQGPVTWCGAPWVWKRVADLTGFDQVVVDQCGGCEIQPPANLGLVPALSGILVPKSSTDFDVSQLDPSTLTAYFSWGWFITATGWLIGKGVEIFIRFLRTV